MGDDGLGRINGTVLRWQTFGHTSCGVISAGLPQIVPRVEANTHGGVVSQLHAKCAMQNKEETYFEARLSPNGVVRMIVV